jgi:pyruvate dehydrogenase E2 component (dihydrolipoamide acetyltransferase)
MTRSRSTIPHFTYVDEVEMDKLVALRDSLAGSPVLGGQKINYLPFVVKAVVLALKQFPALNASVDDAAGELVYKSRYNIGIATATPEGLTVPVLKNADRKNILDISREISELADRARNRRSTMDDISDGTFTITSLGRLGGLFATPIINHPEVGILGIHNLQERAVVRRGQIVVRQMMNISVSFDHRVVDGDVGASFAQTVKSFLEEPGSILLSLT